MIPMLARSIELITMVKLGLCSSPIAATPAEPSWVVTADHVPLCLTSGRPLTLDRRRPGLDAEAGRPKPVCFRSTAIPGSGQRLHLGQDWLGCDQHAEGCSRS